MEGYVIFVTTSTEDEAYKIARSIVEERLAGCVNIVRNIRSIYSWEGKIEDDTEALMIIKTKTGLFQDLMKRIKELHTYSVPEVIALPIVDGSEDYLRWLKEVTN